jgi:hypothetical protein
MNLSSESQTKILDSYAYVISREYGEGDRTVLDGQPQWIEWVARGYVGKLKSQANGVLRDANAIAPANLTRGRLVYIFSDAPQSVKVRFSTVYNHFKSQGDLTVVALQKGAIASCLSLPDNPESYDRCWRNWDYNWQMGKVDSLYLKDGTSF